MEVEEGSVNILVPIENLSIPREEKQENRVFYNARMEFNRDVSVLVLDCYAKNMSRAIKVLDTMTGCGITGIRYAAEVENVAYVLLNDFQGTAAELARQNAERNNVRDRTEAVCMDANLVLALHATPHNRFDVIDLDPFGSPTPFLDSAVRAASNDALIAVTATDMPPLCGIRPNAALRKYGGRPLRTEYCHEIAVRLLIASLVSIAARHNLAIDVKLAHSADHYVRAYVTIRHGGTCASRTLGRLGYITHCFHCLHREFSSRLQSIGTHCRICNHRYAFAGPLWLGSLYDRSFCKEMLNLATTKRLRKRNRIIRLLKTILDEIEYPTYYRVDRLCDRFQTPTPKPDYVVREIREMGYSASLTHFHGYGIRTDAGPKILEQTLRGLTKKPCS